MSPWHIYIYIYIQVQRSIYIYSMKYIVNSLKDVEKNMYMTNKYNVAYIYIYS